MERHFGEWRELRSDAAHKLLPQYRVFAIAWRDRSEAQDISVPWGGSVTLALRRDGSEFSELQDTGNYEEYGRLLAKNGVLLRNSEDGKLIWDGFCDLHHKQWREQKIERKDDQTWHLGVITIDRLRDHDEVKLDASLKVVSAILRSEAVASEEPLSSDRDHAMGIRSR